MSLNEKILEIEYRVIPSVHIVPMESTTISFTPCLTEDWRKRSPRLSQPFDNYQLPVWHGTAVLHSIWSSLKTTTLE